MIHQTLTDVITTFIAFWRRIKEPQSEKSSNSNPNTLCLKGLWNSFHITVNEKITYTLKNYDLNSNPFVLTVISDASIHIFNPFPTDNHSDLLGKLWYSL